MVSTRTSSKKKGASNGAVEEVPTPRKLSTTRRASSHKKSAAAAAAARADDDDVQADADATPAASTLTSRKLAPKALQLLGNEAATSVTDAAAAAVRRNKDAHDSETVKEFGGPIGVSIIAIIFPLLMLYFWSALEFHNGQIYYPKDLTSTDSWREFGQLYVSHIRERAMPTLYSVQIYIGYVLFSALLAYIMPGAQVKGMPVPSLNYKQLVYNCNGYSSFYFTLFVSLIANHYKYFPLRDIVDNFGGLLMTAIITGWFMSIMTYILTLALGTAHRLSGNHIYDFFMGAPLNPRVGSLDLKMWSEIRVPWIILFYVSLSAVVKIWEDHGANAAAVWQVPAGLYFTLLGHWLYVNACMKGEDCIPVTWYGTTNKQHTH